MDHPLISVVINSYNQAAFLEETIRSVIEQDYPNTELLLVDGGSNDGSLEIIRKYQDHFQWWVSEPDQGQADGINKGLRRATGDMVAWLNSDDYYLPGALSRAASAFAVHPQAALWYGDVVAVDENGDPFHNIPCGQYELKDLMTFHILNQPAVFMNRQALNKAGYLDLQYHYLLDHQLWLRMALQGELIHSPEVWAAGRYHSAAKNIANAGKFGEEAYRIATWLLTDDSYQSQAGIMCKSIQAGAHRMNARYLLDADQPRSAFVAYWKGLVSDFAIIRPELHRMLYCLFAMIGLKPLKSLYLRLRRFLQPVNMESK